MESRTLLLSVVGIAALGNWGCSGSSPNPSGNGGSSTVTVGGSSSGGPSTDGANAGGAKSTGGTKSGGGAASIGGKSAVGGSNATGGIPGIGGAVTGGAAPLGGSANTGGSIVAGGANATGGSKSAGGTKATGGSKASGGTKSTGGSSATLGGAGTTGGAGLGGSSSTTIPTGLLNPSFTTTWNPGILADTQLNLPLGSDGLPVRTTVCASPQPGANLNTAISGCPEGQVVQLAAGKYTVSSTVTLMKGVVLRGAGSQGSAAGGTTIVMTGGASVLAIGSDQDQACYASDFSTGYALTQNAVKETNVVTVGSNASRFTAGDLAIIDQVDDATVQEGDCGYFKRVDKRSVSERVEVAAVNTTAGTLTLTTPLHWTFQSASPYLAQIARVNTGNVVKWAGIEGIYLQGGSNPSYTGQMAGGIEVSNAAYCWIKDVQTDATIGGMHIDMTGTYRCVVRDSYVHHSADYGFGADCYGIVLRCGAADNLVENNIARYMNKPIQLSVSGGGNVIGYNYADNAWADPPTFQEDTFDTHCSFPHMELMEGNYVPHMKASTTHGNSGYLTYFRNYASSQFAPPPVAGSTAKQTGNILAVGFDPGDLNMTVIGNVLGSSAATDLGTAPISTTYTCFGDGVACIYYFGNNTDISYTSLWAHGNYDTVTPGVVWNSKITTHVIPASLYLTGKPAWWPSGSAWPWTGSDLTPMVGTLPAKARAATLGP